MKKTSYTLKELMKTDFAVELVNFNGGKCHLRYGDRTGCGIDLEIKTNFETNTSCEKPACKICLKLKDPLCIEDREHLT